MAALAPLVAVATQAGRMPLVRLVPPVKASCSPVGLASAPVWGVTTSTAPAPPRTRFPAASVVPVPPVLSMIRLETPVPVADAPLTLRLPTVVVVEAPAAALRRSEPKFSVNAPVLNGEPLVCALATTAPPVMLVGPVYVLATVR